MVCNRRVCFVLVTVIFYNSVQGSIPEFPPVTYNLNRISNNDWEKLHRIPDGDYEQAARLGQNSVEQDAMLEMNLRSRGIIAERPSEAYVQYIESRPDEKSQKLDEIAKRIIKSNSYFVHKICLPKNIDPNLCAQYLASKSLPVNSDIRQQCQKIDDRGMYAYTRLLSARYKDGIYQMVDEPAVPRPRRLAKNSDNLSGSDQNHPEHNMLIIQWAQFIEHDLSKPISTTMRNGDPINCCTSDQQMLAPRYKHPACAPLEGDERRDEYTHISCQNYVRSARTVNANCTFGPAVMLNQENGQLDLSQLYGVLPETQAEMRTFHNGLLKHSGDSDPSQSFLPLASDSTRFCTVSNSRDCYMAGDSRVNSNPLTTQLYTIFLRSHNLIAQDLKRQNPNYSDEDLFMLARKKNVDQYVTIVYEWWLPTVLGEHLATSTRGVRSTHVQKTVSSEFGVAAIRFYLSMMPDTLKLRHPCTTETDLLDFSEHMYNSDFLKSNCEMDSLLDAMLTTSPQKADIYYKPIILKNWLKSRNNAMGINCLALDIQRGRDHGLASYIDYLEVCARTKVFGWESLEPFIDTMELNILKRTYANVNDIDLIMGAMSEKQTHGLLGVTFSCIIADQFSKIWNQMPNKVDLKQNETSAAEFLCRTTGIQSVPWNIFKIKSQWAKLTTRKQFEALVGLMESNKEIARGFFQGGIAKVDVKEKWSDFSTLLNALGPPSRDVSGWMKVWTDLKFKARKKMAHNRTEIKSTGGGPNRIHCFTDLEEQVISLLNLSAAFDPPGNEFGLKGLISPISSSPNKAEATKRSTLKSAQALGDRECNSVISMDIQSEAAEETVLSAKTLRRQGNAQVKKNDKENRRIQLLEEQQVLQKEGNAKAEETLKYTKRLYCLKKKEMIIRREVLRLKRAKHPSQAKQTTFNKEGKCLAKKIEMKKAFLEFKKNFWSISLSLHNVS